MSFLYSRRGFSLIELIIAIGLMSILFGLALPPFVEWRRNMTYKQKANDIASALKGAKSRAISTNFQHRVVLNSASGSYQTGRGDSAYRSTNFDPAGLAGGILPNNVFLNLSGATTAEILFNPNGTVNNNYSLNVGDNNSLRYNIAVEKSGRIKMYRR